MRRLLSIDPTVVAKLTPADAVETFRQLLCAEAHRLGIPSINVNVPAAVTVADGGIDASVNTSAPLPADGLICSRLNRFQIKTGAFKPWEESRITQELFGSGTIDDKASLGPAVRHCMDNGGRYVLVCFGLDVVEMNMIKARENLTKHFIACGYPNPHIEVIGQSSLISACEHFGGIVRRLGPPANDAIRDHRRWSQEEEMDRTFAPNQPQEKFIEDVRAALRSSEVKHIRICGEAGIGKTRLALEATRADDLQPRVIYCHAGEISGSSGLLPFLVDDERTQAILVVDECNEDFRAQLVNRLGSHFPRIRVVSIYQDIDITSGITLLVPSPLEETAVVEIIAAHGAPKEVAQRWAPLCSGSPRVAHVIGENFSTNPGDILKPPSSNNVWDRYVQGGRAATDPRADQSRTILRHLALFQRFGFDQPVSDEARAIAAMIEKADPSITWARFREIIAELRTRRILQGERTLYITPQALHIWLWVEWWNTYGGPGFEIDQFVSQLKGNLLKWFTSMFKYAHRSEAANRTVIRLLGPDGPFSDGELLRTEIGSDFFLALTDANPEAALACLERTVGAWSHVQLTQFTTGRSAVRFALERIVVWRSLFSRGARLLLALAEAENERWSNNSTGVFAALFSPGYGAVAPSEASPEERFPVLAEALSSNNPARRAIGLRAADRALESGHFSRAQGAEYQGLKQAPKLWHPKTWGELFDAYRRVWQLLAQQVAQREQEERDRIAKIMLTRSRGLVRQANLATEVITTLRDLLATGILTPKAVTEFCEDALQRDDARLESGVRVALTELRDSLVGQDLASRLKRYIGLNRRQDHFEDLKSTDRWERIADGLADEVMQDPSSLTAALPWLVTSDADNAGPFGLRIGHRDSDWKLKKSIIEATVDAEARKSFAFVGGYMRAMAQRDTSTWEVELDRWAADAVLTHFVVEVTWRSGITDRAIQRLIRLLSEGKAELRDLGMIRYAQPIGVVSDTVILELIDTLASEQGVVGIALAVEFLHDYYHQATETSRPFPLEIAERVLTDPRLFSESASSDQSMTDYFWVRLAHDLIEVSPQSGPRLLGLLIDHCDEGGGYSRRHDGDFGELFDAILEASPNEAWEIVVKRLNSEDKSAQYRALSWLSGGSMLDDLPGHWGKIPLDRLWSWVDEKVNDRAWLVATVAPKGLDASELNEITRQLLVRYGDRDDVQENLSARFMSGGWWGHASDHYTKVKKIAEGWLNREVQPRAREWLTRYIQDLVKTIEHARIQEERERF